MKQVYIRTKLNSLINVTEIVTIHYYEFDNSFKFVGEKHNFWEMVYVDSGAVEIIRDGESIILNQGEILFHEPNEFHSIKSYNSSPNLFVLSFVCNSPAMNHFKKFTASLNRNLKPFIVSILSEAENTYETTKNDINLKKLVIKNTAPIGSEQLIKTYLEQFLIILVRNILIKNDISIFPSKESLETQLVSDIKEYIASRLEDKLTVDDICNKFGYSKTYLSQLFKSQCSISLIKYYNTKKISYAKKLIRENKYNFTQISNMLFFDNPQYFSRVFKRIAGLTPTEFAESLQIKDNTNFEKNQ